MPRVITQNIVIRAATGKAALSTEYFRQVPWKSRSQSPGLALLCRLFLRIHFDTLQGLAAHGIAVQILDTNAGIGKNDGEKRAEDA